MDLFGLLQVTEQILLCFHHQILARGRLSTILQDLLLQELNLRQLHLMVPICILLVEIQMVIYTQVQMELNGPNNYNHNQTLIKSSTETADGSQHYNKELKEWVDKPAWLKVQMVPIGSMQQVLVDFNHLPMTLNGMEHIMLLLEVILLEAMKKLA